MPRLSASLQFTSGYGGQRGEDYEKKDGTHGHETEKLSHDIQRGQVNDQRPLHGCALSPYCFSECTLPSLPTHSDEFFYSFRKTLHVNYKWF